LLERGLACPKRAPALTLTRFDQKAGLTPQKAGAAMRLLQCSWSFSMKEIVDQALGAYEFIGEMDVAVVAQSREKIIRYIDQLTSAGLTDQHQLTEYARAYLKELHEGPDPRFSGC
jgi:uroporphyrinogen-III decarboxylase